MKKTKWIVVCIISVLLLAGCGSSGTSSSGNNSSGNSSTPPATQANAGNDVYVQASLVATLDGSESTVADPLDTLTYSWSFVSVPVGSAVSDLSLTGASTVSPSFTPDVEGEYVLSLVVNDGTDSSDPDRVTVISSIGTVAAPIDITGKLPFENSVVRYGVSRENNHLVLDVTPGILYEVSRQYITDYTGIYIYGDDSTYTRDNIVCNLGEGAPETQTCLIRPAGNKLYMQATTYYASNDPAYVLDVVEVPIVDTLMPGVPMTGTVGKEKLLYEVSVTPDAGYQFDLTGLSEDADLEVFDPVYLNYPSCFSRNVGTSDESCIDGIGSDKYYVSVNGLKTVTGTTFTLSIDEITTPAATLVSSFPYVGSESGYYMLDLDIGTYDITVTGSDWYSRNNRWFSEHGGYTVDGASTGIGLNNGNRLYIEVLSAPFTLSVAPR